MRKIATLALAAALSIAALAPAAFAKPADCTGKDFASGIQAAQQDGRRGQAKKDAAITSCLGHESTTDTTPCGGILGCPTNP